MMNVRKKKTIFILLMLLIPSLVQFAPTGATKISDTTESDAIKGSHKIVYINETYFLFYCNDSRMVYRASEDGSSWSAETDVEYATSGEDFSVAVNDTHIHYARYNSSDGNLTFRRGTVSGTTITWETAQTLYDGTSTTYYDKPVLYVDEYDGYLYLLLNRVSNGFRNLYFVKSIHTDGTFTTPSPRFIAITEEVSSSKVTGKMLFDPDDTMDVYGKRYFYIMYCRSNKLYTQTCYLYESGGLGRSASYERSSLINDPDQFDLLLSGTDAYIAFIHKNTDNLQYYKWDVSYWGYPRITGSTTISTSTTSSSKLSLSKDTSGNPYIFYFNATNDHIYYSTYQNGTWATETDLIDESASGLNTNAMASPKEACTPLIGYVTGSYDLETEMIGSSTYDAAPTIHSLSPASGTTGTNINPILSVNISEPESAQMSVEWVSNRSGTWATFQTSTGLSNGTTSITPTGFSNASTKYYWYVNVSDGGNFTTSSIYNFTTKANDASPELSNASLNYDWGVVNETLFQFNVTWKEADGSLPSDGFLTINISRDDGYYKNESMSYVSGDHTSAAIYTYLTLLPQGNYTYTFHASDGTNYNSSGPYTGPNATSASFDINFPSYVLSGDYIMATGHIRNLQGEALDAYTAVTQIHQKPNEGWNRADITLDGIVDMDDVNIVMDNYGWLGEPGGNIADLNSNGEVEALDVSIAVGNYGEEIPIQHNISWYCSDGNYYLVASTTSLEPAEYRIDVTFSKPTHPDEFTYNYTVYIGTPPDEGTYKDATLYISFYNTNLGLGLPDESLNLFIDGVRKHKTEISTYIGDTLNITVKDYYNNTLYENTSYEITDVHNDLDLGLTFHEYAFTNTKDEYYIVGFLRSGASRWFEKPVPANGQKDFLLPTGNYTIRAYNADNSSYTSWAETVNNSRGFLIEGSNVSAVIDGLSVVRGSILEVNNNLDYALTPDVETVCSNPPIVKAMHSVDGRQIADGVFLICPALVVTAETRQSDTNSSIASVALVPSNSSVSNGTVTLLRDTLYFEGAASTSYVNITYTNNGTLLQNTSYIPNKLELYGENVTINSSNDIKVTRETKYHQYKKFDWTWYSYESKYETGIEIINPQNASLYDIDVLIEFAENSSPDVDSVTVKDVSNNNVILEAGKNFKVTDTGIEFSLLSINASSTRRFQCKYFSKMEEQYTFGIKHTTLETYDYAEGGGKYETTAQWIYNDDDDKVFNGVLYIDMNFEEATDIKGSSVTVFDDNADRQLSRDAGDFMVMGSTIVISDSGLGTVSPGASKHYTIQFLMTENDGEIADFNLKSILFMVGGFPITVWLIGVIVCLAVVAIAFFYIIYYNNRKPTWTEWGTFLKIAAIPTLIMFMLFVFMMKG